MIFPIFVVNLFFLIQTWAFTLAADNGVADTRCSPSSPCLKGCCSKFGFCGYGPEFRSSDSCTSSCEVKSECKAATWPPGFSQTDKCPLNVCCSKHGFCGITKDFCGDSQVVRPSCSSETPFQRVVGYYEGWNMNRPCQRFPPENIPIGAYTHLNFAFATIDPETYAIQPADMRDAFLYQRLTALKIQDPSLRIYVAIGGWSFSDPGPTRKTFSELAASLEKQRQFFKSLTSFMATYGFDGVDIDWEYPVVEDRGGAPEDYTNFVTFISNLKDTLRYTGGRNGLSITLPASYWYLQHFDVVKLEPLVEFFNLMSYDMHGIWDKDNEWTGPFLNSHTNLTELDAAMDLLWRNNISPEKVSMGLAFYARVFTLKDTNCKIPGPNCHFNGAGTPGRCSAEGGVLMNSEVENIIKQKALTPEYDRDAAVQMVNWDDQWLTFDDSKARETKISFARSRCLGGLMVWAVTHDNQNASHSVDVARLSGVSRAVSQTKSHKLGARPLEQCTWVGCGESCPRGYGDVQRTDKDHRANEVMQDGTGCPRDQIRLFCCPLSERAPQCGWYGFNNGKCQIGRCPKERPIEVGSTNIHCRKRGTAQTACCDSTPSIGGYDSCAWSRSKNCDLNNCPDKDTPDKYEKLGVSLSGSGGLYCSDTPRHREHNEIKREEIKGPAYCCNRKMAYNPPREGGIKSCNWYEAGASISPASAVDGPLNLCTANPVCPQNDLFSLSQQFSVRDNASVVIKYTAVSLAESMFSDTPVRVLGSILATMGYQLSWNSLRLEGETLKDYITVWDDTIGAVYAGLTIVNIMTYLDLNVGLEYRLSTYMPFASQLLCHINYYDGKIRWKVLGDEPDECPLLPVEEMDSDPETLGGAAGSTHESGDLDPRDTTESDVPLGNGKEWKFRFLIPSTVASTSTQLGSIQNQGSQIGVLVRMSRPWNSPGVLAPGDPIRQEAYNTSSNDCVDLEMTNDHVAAPGTPGFDREHIIEQNTVQQFFDNLAFGIPNPARPADPFPRWAQLPTRFFTSFFGEPVLLDAPALPFHPRPGARANPYNSDVPSDRLFDALGSVTNDRGMPILEHRLNGMKNRLWERISPINPSRMNGWVDGRRARGSHPAVSPSPRTAIRALRQVILAMAYLRAPAINRQMVENARAFRDQLQIIQDEWNRQNPFEQIDLVRAWNIWFPGLAEAVTNHARTWVQDHLDRLYNQNQPLAAQRESAGSRDRRTR